MVDIYSRIHGPCKVDIGYTRVKFISKTDLTGVLGEFPRRFGAKFEQAEGKPAQPRCGPPRRSRR